MANKTTAGLGYSPLTGAIYWGRRNEVKGVWVGEKRDVTNMFLQVMEHKFPVGYKQNIIANGKHHSTIYNLSPEVEVITFKPVNPEEIDNDFYLEMADKFGLRDYDTHGCCEACRLGVSDDDKSLCKCDELRKVQLMILSLANRSFKQTNGGK